MPVTPHTSCRKGKRVTVGLKNGETFIDKFVGRKGSRVLFENREVIRGQIKSFSIYKGPQ